MRQGFPVATRGMVVGLLGGSFDPAHEGHVHITREALKRVLEAFPQASVLVRAFDRQHALVLARVGFVCVLRYEYRAIDDQKIGVTGRQSSAVRAELGGWPGQGEQRIRLALRIATPS